MRDEFAELPTAPEQGAALTRLGDRPPIVVTAVTEALVGWPPLQDEMVTLSTNSVHRVLPHCANVARSNRVDQL